MRSRAHHLAAATAAAAVSGCILSGLLGLFDNAAPPWLAATPANQQRMAQCHGAQGSAARQACASRVVAEATQKPDDRLATAPSAGNGPVRAGA